MELLDSTTYFNSTSDQCFWNITLRIYSSYAEYIVINRNTTNTTVSLKLIYPDSLPFDISIQIHINCSVYSNYLIRLQRTIMEGLLYHSLACSVYGTYYQGENN